MADYNSIHTGAEIDAVVSGASLIKIQTQTVSTAVSSVDFTTGIDSTYSRYIIVADNVLNSAGGNLELEVSDDGGTSYKSSNYKYHSSRTDSGASTYNGQNSNTAASFLITSGTTSAVAAARGFTIHIHDPSNAATYTGISGLGVSNDTSLNAQFINVVGHHQEAIAINALRFSLSTGNFTAGTFTLYGIKSS